MQKGLLIKGFLKILLNDGVFDMEVLELKICEVNGRRWQLTGMCSLFLKGA